MPKCVCGRGPSGGASSDSPRPATYLMGRGSLHRPQ